MRWTSKSVRIYFHRVGYLVLNFCSSVAPVSGQYSSSVTRLPQQRQFHCYGCGSRVDGYPIKEFLLNSLSGKVTIDNTEKQASTYHVLNYACLGTLHNQRNVVISFNSGILLLVMCEQTLIECRIVILDIRVSYYEGAYYVNSLHPSQSYLLF